MVTPLMSKISKSLDAAVAWNLHAHVMDGYEFLMQNYTAGDRICIFGFSRGAYTARCLAGMIHKVGILPACNHQQVPFAYKMYAEDNDKYSDKAKAFKKAFSTNVDIEFIGVWDTVDSVGLIPRTLPFTGSNHIVRTFRHAVALDERRAKFKAKMYWGDDKDEDDGHVDGEGEEPVDVLPKGLKKSLKGTGINRELAIKALKKKYRGPKNGDAENGASKTNVKEVWFAGCHCDVGGGSVKNDTKKSLARIPLRWMIRECFDRDSGIMFNAKLLKERLGMEPSELYPIVKDRPDPLKIDARADIIEPREDLEPGFFSRVSKFLGFGREQKIQDSNGHLSCSSETTLGRVLPDHELDHADLLCPIYDQLSMKWWLWGILEVMPLLRKSPGSIRMRLGINWGHGRVIPEPQGGGKVLVHRSVEARMKAKDMLGKRYRPAAENWQYLKNNDKIKWVN
ncbi:hypothetical protein WG66_009550 [Moniliophthora roreri]|nr:hypothetical protein WG66_009550 [Moniliophthora roreri]